MLCPVPCPSSPASRPVLPAFCISATRSARCSPGAARARPAGGSCCVWRTSIQPAAAPNSPPRSWRTWPGSASTGMARCACSRSICADYRAVLDALAARGLLYPCFCTRADIQQSAAAPHTPDGAPLYPGTCRALSPRARGAHRRRRALCAAARHGAGAGGDAGADTSRRQAKAPSHATPNSSATSSSPARTLRPATTCASRTTMRCRASRW